MISRSALLRPTLVLALIVAVSGCSSVKGLFKKDKDKNEGVPVATLFDKAHRIDGDDKQPDCHANRQPAKPHGPAQNTVKGAAALVELSLPGCAAALATACCTVSGAAGASVVPPPPPPQDANAKAAMPASPYLTNESFMM